MPGFVEIDLVGHEGGNSSGEFAMTLTVTDIFTGWTINRSVKNKAAIWVFEAIEYVISQFPFPILGIDSDNGSEFINHHLFNYCTEHEITFTRSRSGNKNDGAHVEQKNWTHIRQWFGYERYDNPAVVPLLNGLTTGPWNHLLNFFCPVMKLARKERVGTRLRRVYDEPATPLSLIHI